MKILQVGPIPPEIGGKTVGGVATHVWDLSMHLAKRGHNVAILADNFLNTPAIPIIKDGVKVYGFSKAFVLKLLPSVLSNSITIYKLKKHFRDLIGITGVIPNFCYYKYVLHHFRPNIIHVHHLETRFPFAYFVSKGKVPVVTTAHSFNTVKFFDERTSEKYRRLLADNIRISKYLIFPSKFISEELDELFHVPFKGKRWVMTNPIDTSRYYPIPKDEARSKIGISDNGSVILFVGNLMKKKGIYTLVEAAAILRDKGVQCRILIVGDGEERKKLEEFIKAKSVEAIVSLEGLKYLPELLYYYNAADLFVMPSTSESWGLVYVEAMSCGIPVIGTNVTAIPEVISSDEYGFRVPLHDSTALADTIQKALFKNWNSNKILEYARSFSWEKRINEFDNVYGCVSGVDEA